jgi:hypothetical protein
MSRGLEEQMMLKVYLAGAVRGTHGAWRDRIPQIDGIRFMHPGARLPAPRRREAATTAGAALAPGGEHRSEELRDEIYTPADRVAVHTCEVLLAHCDRIEGGHGTAVEIGMALALGKEVLLICPSEESRYVWRFAAGCVPHVYESLEEAVDVLRYMAGQVGGTARCAAG